MSDAALGRLLDRQEISDLLVAFARALDANHVIEVEGDRAQAQSYMLAIHVPDAARAGEPAAG